MKLYYSPGACSLSPHIVLREAELPFDRERVDLKEKKTETGADYRAINPKGSVPALQLDDGPVLTEGPAIVQYVADQVPTSGLVPAAGTLDRYRLIEWLNFITSELHKGFSPLFKPDTPDAYKVIAKENLKQRIAHVDRALQGRSYLMGEQFTVADAYLFVVLRWTKPMEIDLSPYANVAAFQARVAARPKVRDALAAEGLQ